MRIAVIGGGVAGASFAVRRKRNHPNDEVYIFEHSDKLLKKVLATGNGKCNIGNKGDLNNIYNCSLAKDILSQYDYQLQNEFLDSINIKTKLMDNLSYPISESAVTVRNAFIKALEVLKVNILLEERIEDYVFKDNKYLIKSTKGEYLVDLVVFATGGKSSPKLGSDGSILPLLLKHNYKLKDFSPALCPIYVKEKTKVLDGTRVKAEVSLFENSNLIFKERGEVLFKERGLSGIVIFNMSRIIARDDNKEYQIKIDLLPDVSAKELTSYMLSHDKSTLLESYLHPNLVKYLSSLNGDAINLIKSLPFTFDKLYGFDNSQISVGGIEINEVNKCLESKKEKDIYFIGEILDVDAPCGGYNLMWAIGSGLYLADNLK